MESKAAQQYLNQVRRFLVCDKTGQKQLLGRCGELMESFQQENPDTEYGGFVAAFGEPADCAADLLSTLDVSRVEAAGKRRRRLHRIAIAVMSAAVILSVSTAVCWYLKYQQSIIFDEDVIVVIEPPVEDTLEEFYAAKEQEAQLNGGKK